MLFQGLFKRAERTIDSAISRFVDRAAVAVPLIAAGGFATAALSLKLIELYGAVSAYTMMAVLFAVIGLITMVVNARSNEVPAEAGETSDPGATESEKAEDEGPSLPPEMMSVLTSIAPAAAPGIARGVVRNLPLIFILALVAFVISRFAAAASSDEAASPSGDEDPASETQNAA